jgi:AcrR family transcriptional regulator
MSPESPRKTDTRQALLDAALQVFLRHGFARATTREIAQTAGVAEGTIYRHFADKHALFHDVFVSLMGEAAEELLRFRERAGRETVRDNLEQLFTLVGGIQEQLSSLMASMWADPDLAKNVSARARELAPEGLVPPGPVSMVAEYIRAEQEFGRIRSDVDATEAAAVVVSVPFAAGMERAFSEHPWATGEFPVPDDFPTPAAGALDILARGLAPASTAPSEPPLR